MRWRSNSLTFFDPSGAITTRMNIHLLSLVAAAAFPLSAFAQSTGNNNGAGASSSGSAGTIISGSTRNPGPKVGNNHGTGNSGSAGTIISGAPGNGGVVAPAPGSAGGVSGTMNSGTGTALTGAANGTGITTSNAAQLFRELDTDHDGKLGPEEFARIAVTPNTRTPSADTTAPDQSTGNTPRSPR